MAFHDSDTEVLLWCPQLLPEDLLLGSYVQLSGEDSPPEAHPGPAGFIIHNWFGPFLLASPSRFLRGRC